MPERDADNVSPEVLSALRDMVERDYGIVLGEEKLPQFRRIIRERMKTRMADDPHEYLALVQDAAREGKELKALVARLVVGETSFFRSPGQFEILAEKLLPDLAASGAPLPLKVWSAGCATGEEPYSLAISALEAFHGRFLEPAAVLATDAHAGFLEAARKGVYPASALRNVPPALHDKYFTALPDGRRRVADEVRRLVTFREENLLGLLANPPRERCSVIFCRNVMIYFHPDTVRALVAMFHDRLEKDGYLFLGHSEALWGISEAFELERHGGFYYYRKKAADPQARHAASRPSAAAGKGTRPRPPSAARPAPPAARPAPVPPPPAAVPGRRPENAGPEHDLLGKAGDLADRGLLPDAFLACREAMAAAPGSPEGPYLAAVLLRRQGKVPEALFYAERALSFDAGFVLARVEAAECLHLLGKPAAAAGEWRTILRQLEGPVRLPRRPLAAGQTARTLRAYAAARLGPARG